VEDDPVQVESLVNPLRLIHLDGTPATFAEELAWVHAQHDSICGGDFDCTVSEPRDGLAIDRLVRGDEHAWVARDDAQGLSEYRNTEAEARALLDAWATPEVSRG
jgi:hypothetical protein